MRGTWVLVLSLFGGFIPRISSRQGLGFGTLEGIISRISSEGGLGLGHGSGSEPVTLSVTLIISRKMEGGWRLLIVFSD